MFHHKRAITALPGQLPLEPQLAVEVTVLPVQLLLQLVSGPFAKADNRPHGAAQRTAAAETATQQPAHVYRQSFTQGHIHTGYCGLKHKIRLE